MIWLEKLDAVSAQFQPGVNSWNSPKQVKYLSGKRPPAFLALHLVPCLSLLEIELVRICACQWSTNINRILFTHFSACFMFSFFISTDLYVYIKDVVGRPGQRVRLNPNKCRPRGNRPEKLQCSTRSPSSSTAALFPSTSTHLTTTMQTHPNQNEVSTYLSFFSIFFFLPNRLLLSLTLRLPDMPSPAQARVQLT